MYFLNTTPKLKSFFYQHRVCVCSGGIFNLFSPLPNNKGKSQVRLVSLSLSLSLSLSHSLTHSLTLTHTCVCVCERESECVWQKPKTIGRSQSHACTHSRCVCLVCTHKRSHTRTQYVCVHRKRERHTHACMFIGIHSYEAL